MRASSRPLHCSSIFKGSVTFDCQVSENLSCSIEINGTAPWTPSSPSITDFVRQPVQGKLELTDEDLARMSKDRSRFHPDQCSSAKQCAGLRDQADGMQLSDEELAKYIGTESQRMSKVSCVAGSRETSIDHSPDLGAHCQRLQAAYRKRAHDQVYHGKPAEVGKSQRTDLPSRFVSSKSRIVMRNQNFSAVVPVEEPPLPESGVSSCRCRRTCSVDPVCRCLRCSTGSLSHSSLWW